MFKHAIGSLLILLLSALIATALLLGTQRGTRLLVSAAGQFSDGALQVESVHGDFLGELELRGVQLELRERESRVGRLYLKWRPVELARGQLHLESLQVSDTRLNLPDGGAAEADSGEPTRPGDLPLAIRLDALDISEVEIQWGQETLARIGRLNGALLLAGNQLKLTDLNTQGLDLSGMVPELAGPLNAKLDLRAHRAERQWLLDRLNLELPDQSSRLALSGRADLGRPDTPVLDATLNWSSLRWPLHGDRRFGSPEGQLTLKGTADDYQATLTGRLDSQPLKEIRLRINGSGNREGFKLKQGLVELLNGSLSVNGDLSWAPAVRAELELAAHELDPAPLAPGLPETLRLSADGGITYEGERLTIRRLQLRPGPGTARVTLDGTVVKAEEPMDTELELRLTWEGLSWPLDGDDPLASSPDGTLAVSGKPPAYRLQGGFELTGREVPEGHWTLRAHGGLESLRLESLRGEILDGSLEMNGEMGWAGRPEWALSLLTESINPAGVVPDLPGRLDLKSKIGGRLDDAGAPRLKWEIQELSGQLLDHPIGLRGILAVDGDSYLVQGLKLVSGRNRLDLDGGLGGERLDLTWSLAFTDPASLLPGASGSLTGNGSVGGSLKQPSVTASLQGSGLALDNHRLETLEADLQAALTPRAPLKIKVEAIDLRQDGNPLLDRAVLTAGGSLDKHELTLALQAPAQGLTATLQGTADPSQANWKGRLARLELDTGTAGNWKLTEPAPLSLSEDQVLLKQACLAQVAATGRMCADIEHRAGSRSRLDLTLAGLAVKSLLPKVTGELAAHVDGSLAVDGGLRADIEGTLSKGEVTVQVGDRSRRLTHQGGRLKVEVAETGLVAELHLYPLREGSIDANLELPGLNRLPMPDDQPVSGTLRADIGDLTPLQAFVPQLTNTDGKLLADMTLSGRLPVPRIEGALALKDGTADVDAIGLRLREAGLELRADPEDPKRWLLNGNVKSGDGELSLRGGGGIDLRDIALYVKGSDFSVVDVSFASVHLDPDLNIHWKEGPLATAGDRPRLGGRLHIPVAKITPQLDVLSLLGGEAEQLDSSPGRAVTPSPDVVIVDEGGETGEPGATGATTALPFYGDLLITLGDEVKVDAVGLRCQFTGEVALDIPEQRTDSIPLASGQITLENGVFRSFGQDLEIDPTSQLVFNGGPADSPELNLRAKRWIRNDDQVNAVGLHISGTPDAARMDLFSEPQLDEQTTLSYLLTGKAPDSAEQMVSVGTRLGDDLYVGYGINLLEQTHEFNMRYDILRWFALEADVGEADKSVTFSYTQER